MNKYNRIQKKEGLSIKAKTRLSVLLIIVLILFFGVMILPVKPSWLPAYGFFNKFYPHLGLDLRGGTHLLYEADLSNVAAGDKDSALAGARDVIERRVNALGVAEPVVEVSKRGSSSRLIIELAGVQNVNEAINRIGETPLLEFKETSTAPATSTPADPKQLDEIQTYNKGQEALAKQIIQRLQKGEDFAALSKQYSEDDAVKNTGGDLGWVAQGVFTKVFDDAIFNQMKVGELRSQPLLSEFGYHIIKKLGERTNADGKKEVHAAHILLKTKSLAPAQGPTWVNTQLSGKDLTRADVTFVQQTSEPQVSLTFNSHGADLFKQITERNVGKPVGIFLDGSVISAPTVQTVITGGQAVITGNFTLDEAKVLAQRLNAGALPVPVKLISQQTVGATLGNDSLDKSLRAGVIGLSLVAIFMILYYLLPGLLSVIALLIYGIITMGVFEAIPVTLTLAGVAGFILSIGMAVDANVLIFERIKEELRRGVTFQSAVEDGFTRAWPSIRDSNISTLITCAILYWFGTSIIRGFAVTLSIGVLLSMFSAITVTRTLLRLIVTRKMVQRPILFGVRKKANV